MMPGHAPPIVEPLHWLMNVLVGFEFDHGKAPFARYRQHINHGAVGSRKCENLRIEARRIQPAIQGADVFHHQRFQPAFGMQPP